MKIRLTTKQACIILELSKNERGDNMKERLLHLRKDILNKSRVKFGEPIGMTDSEIKNIENGITDLKENKIPLICREYNVREEWLRTGQGDIFQPVGRGEEIGQIVRSAAQTDPEEAVSFFRTLLEGMSDAEILLMYEVFKRHFPTKE